jgi:hypothetical protein
MRYVALAGLEPLTAKARDSAGQLVDAPFVFADLVRYFIDGDKRFVSDASGIRSALRVEEQLAKANGFLALEEADWVRLKEAAESPSVPYPLAPPRRLSPFLDAIQKAPERQPTKPKGARE